MVRKVMPWLVACAIFAAAAIALRPRTPGPRTFADLPTPRAAAFETSRDTVALPRLEPGATIGTVTAAFPPGVTPRQVPPVWRPEGEAWEWSGPAGRYAAVEFVRGGLAVAQVRRPPGAGLPAVEAALLPSLHAGLSREHVERAIGRGWPVGRSTGVAGAGEIVTCAWAVRDHGVGTGAVLQIGFQDGRAVAIDHPWAGR